MKQGEIWYADLNPVEGSEQAGLSPVVILSGNLLNTYAPVLICCPLTTNLKNYKGNVVIQPDNMNRLSLPSEILTFHVNIIGF
jgi:mRNA interferase MazF